MVLDKNGETALERMKVSNILPDKSWETAPERMKSLGQRKNDTHLWVHLVVKVKSSAVKNNTAQEPGLLAP